MTKIRLATVSFAAVLATVGLQGWVAAQTPNDHDLAFVAVREFGVMPYGKIRDLVQDDFSGRVIGQQLFQVNPNLWVYEFKILRTNGQLLNVLANAVDGRVIEVRGE